MFGLAGPPDTKKSEELLRADTFLTTLATTMKPMNPVDAIF